MRVHPALKKLPGVGAGDIARLVKEAVPYINQLPVLLATG
jgi:hypothetical protein